ncbi:hypothetical protein IRJ41_019089, partial [Triplophysa rosa]
SELSSKKQGFKKCRSATFSIDGFNFTIVANEAGESCARPLARFARSKSQNALWNAITAGIGIKDKDKRGILIDPRSPEEILADDLPSVDTPDAMEKTAISKFMCNATGSGSSPLNELITSEVRDTAGLFQKSDCVSSHQLSSTLLLTYG